MYPATWPTSAVRQYYLLAFCVVLARVRVQRNPPWSKGKANNQPDTSTGNFTWRAVELFPVTTNYWTVLIGLTWWSAEIALHVTNRRLWLRTYHHHHHHHHHELFMLWVADVELISPDGRGDVITLGPCMPRVAQCLVTRTSDTPIDRDRTAAAAGLRLWY